MLFKTNKIILPLLLCGLLLIGQSIGTRAQSLTIDAMDETGQTALMQAAQDGTADEIKKLLKKGAGLEVKDRYGWTALLYAATFNLGYLPNPKPDASALKILLSAGANVNVSDTRGITPLIIAAAEGRTEFVKLLLSKGADVNAKDKNGATALSYAKAKGHVEIVKLLVKSGGAGVEIDKALIPDRISPIDTLPKQLNRIEARPTYTDEARRNEVTGAVRFRILVAADGTIKKAKLLSGLPYGLTEQATQALKKLKVEAGINEGRPVDYWLAIQYTFAIY
jgi:TonB family protein